MTAGPAILAVDLGTSGVKVALITLQGQVLGWESQPIGLLITPDGGAEQSPEEWWQAFLSSSRRLLARGLVPAGEVKAICCSTQGEGTVPVDRDGNALMNCILWMDMRGAACLRRQAKGAVNVMGVDALKLLRWIRLTGGMPSITGKDPAGHMLLVRDHFPDVYACTHKFLNVLDYINLRLTGRFGATPDSILTSWVTDNRDPGAIRYHARLVRDSGIEAAKFPEIVPCTAIFGGLRAEVAEALGLPRDLPVVAGSIDTTAAAIGAGAVADFQPHLYIGTSSWIAAHVPFKKTDPISALASVPCAVPDRYLLIALQATAGGNLTFLRDQIFFPHDELQREEATPDLYQTLDRMAERVPAGSNGVLYTPWIWGERAPVDERTLRAGFYNLSLHNTRADLVRAVLEGVALNTRWLLGPVERFMGRKVESIHLAGGGGNSDVWCQILADVLDVPVRQVQDPILANARGAAFIAAAGLGEITFDDVPGLVPIKRTAMPDPQNRAVYDQAFEAFQQIYRRMSPVYKRLNRRDQV
ncbi:MAG: FGGY-family carbohydrate kinase [Anaerolineae bacterium]|jgi:xylulokinase|nr:FGGY-family carbohydrate kinase [Anaerolineae bacterium]MDX9832065.1 FGGY-family carbohydrate kinase [Anaerolineae bacterium]